MSSGSNVFFNNFENANEQSLIEDLIVESISIYGHGIYYCPRTLGAKDEIYGEDALSIYDTAYELDLYIRSYDSYEGDGSFLSKFNLEIRDQITFTLAKRSYQREIGEITESNRPKEGDLIYSKMMKRMFIVKYVNIYPVFFQMGTLQTWDLVCEVYEYSNERLNTGIPEIDSIEDDFTVANVTSNTEFEDAMNDVFATNDEFEELANNIVDWTTTDPFSEGEF